MIPSSELRKNNLVLRSGQIVEVGWQPLGFEIVPDEPIPLTPSILKKCGLSEFANGILRNAECNLTECDGGYIFGVGFVYFATAIKYLHQLQNKYYYVVNKELTVNL